MTNPCRQSPPGFYPGDFYLFFYSLQGYTWFFPVKMTWKEYKKLPAWTICRMLRILAPEIERYARGEEPYIEFPQGLTAYFYDDSLSIEAYIKAKHVIYRENERLWEAKNNVEGRNLKNKNQLNTEHMFWDEEHKKIYSHTQSRIVNEDGTFYGEKGFEAKQDLSWYRLNKSKGVVNIKDE